MVESQHILFPEIFWRRPGGWRRYSWRGGKRCVSRCRDSRRYFTCIELGGKLALLPASSQLGKKLL
ncbi:hypothetical protein GJA_4321 [Janthinobacterium agaricidamnosum NBRC 102515 = DSM 9628]|uniref:Uncharacterized protein n=1 Tax=Janthinobacterium agaricidamnosum NBRC 102515 = DSM 9628 TaxID=1349767 RepID=W0V7Y7_9BURK|nr:hypothetical protein GJA_4321 [Janthinobacterium agaricidamnosum NBRC 102515 = DSM 9628]